MKQKLKELNCANKNKWNENYETGKFWRQEVKKTEKNQDIY